MISKTTPSRGETLTYRCTPTITWLRDADQTFLVDAERGQFWAIRGVEAAMWDFLILDYSYKKIVRFLSLLLGAATEEAEKTVLAALRDWQSAGIVQVVEEGKCGESDD